MISITECPVCKEKNFKNFLVSQDYFLSQEPFTIVQCDACEFKFTNPRPKEEDLGRYYQSEEYISHSNTKKGFVSWLYHKVRNRTLISKEGLISGYVSRGTLLDYGCGSGHFLAFSKTKGWKTYGIEPDMRARKLAIEMGGAVYQNKEEFSKSEPSLRFSAITLWHVLEHLPDLDAAILFLAEYLSKEGVLVIALPNPASYDANKYKKFWAAYDLPRHLYHFEKASLELLFSKYGFVLKDIKPMYFDSFYVSLLSEKYKRGRPGLIRALFTGLVSNIKAYKSKQYSSVIYVFQKAPASR